MIKIVRVSYSDKVNAVSLRMNGLTIEIPVKDFDAMDKLASCLEETIKQENF